MNHPTTNHLTTDEMIEFVSIKKLNEQSIRLSASVNDHIRECDKCFKLVKSFQLIHDEFLRLRINKSFKDYLSEEVVLETKEKEQPAKVAEKANVQQGKRSNKI